MQPISMANLMWMQNRGPPGDVGETGRSLENYWSTGHSVKDSTGLPITGILIPRWRKGIPGEATMPELI